MELRTKAESVCRQQTEGLEGQGVAQGPEIHGIGRATVDQGGAGWTREPREGGAQVEPTG